MSFGQAIALQKRVNKPTHAVNQATQRSHHHVEDLAQNYDSTDFYASDSLLGHGYPGSTSLNQGGNGELGNPQVITDPFNQIGQYNDLLPGDNQNITDLEAIYIDPLMGQQHGIQEASDARMQKYMDIIRDQATNSNYDQVTKETGSYTVTIVYDDQGRVLSKLFRSAWGYTAFMKRGKNGTTTTYKNSNGEEISQDEWEKSEGSFLRRCWEWLTGGQGNSNITAETDWGGFYWVSNPGGKGIATLTSSIHPSDEPAQGLQFIHQQTDQQIF